MDGRYAKAVLCGRIDPNARDIRLSVDGMDWQLAEVSAALKKLTAAPKKAADGSGDVTVPLTWAMVTQISGLMAEGGHGWRPDPGLNKWIEREFLRRHDETGWKDRDGLKFPVSSLSWTPMPHQLAGAYVGALNERFFFCDDMRPQPADTPVLTTRGWKSLGLLIPGMDRVYAEDGRATTVTEVKHFGRQLVYTVTMSDRTSTRATADHPWHVFTANHRVRPGTALGQTGYVLTTQQLLDRGTTDKAGNSRWFLPQQPVITAGTPSDDLSVDPYAYGALLGDGCLGGSKLSISCPDGDIRDRVREAAYVLGTSSRDHEPQDKCARTDFHRNGDLRDRLHRLGALMPSGEKYVHAAYLRGNADVRRDLLRGLLDTDGTVIRTGAGVEFSSASPMLSAAVAFLGRTLGAVATESDPQAASYVKDGERVMCQDKHRVLLRFPADGPNPFWCERKAAAWQAAAAKMKRPKPPRCIASVEPDGEAEVCCIRIEHESHVYLTDTTLIPTHNTGKTTTLLLTMAEMQARGKNPFPAFVICPASVVDPWLEELELRFPAWPATAYRGGGRRKLSSRYKIYIMSWNTFRDDMKHERELPPLLRFVVPKTVIMDESHSLCNVKTKQSIAAMQIARVTDYAFLASGTPITRDVGGFWRAMSVLDIRSFPDEDKYKDRYTDRYHGDYADKIEGIHKGNLAEFRLLTQGSTRRIAKADVNADLPPVSYSTRVVQIPPAYRAAYDEMAQDMIAHLPDVIEPMEVMGILTQLQRLTQLAGSACDVEKRMEIDENEKSPTFGELVPRYTVTMREPSWKIDELMAILAENEGTGNPLIVFSTHTQLVKLAGARAQAHGYRTGYIIGGQTSKRRTETRRAFQDGSLDLLCANVTAGGVGLTLNRGDAIVFLEPSWAYWQRAQAESRADDIMGAKQIHVIDIVAANTVESRIRQALKDKSRQLSELVRDPRIVESFLGGQPIHVK